MLKVDYQRWIDLTETDHHDLNKEELSQFVNELKDAVGEVIQECKKAYDYYNHIEYENTLLRASAKKLDALIALRGKEPKEEDYPDEDDYAEAYGDYFTAFETAIDSLKPNEVRRPE